MSILAPVLLLALVGLVVLMIMAARKQRFALSRVFADFAAAQDLSFLDEDDGRAERLSRGFDGFASFRSSSLGPKPAQNVVSGTVTEGELCVFSHGVREYQGQARPWFPCIVASPRTPDRGGHIKCLPRRRLMVREVGGLPEVSFDHDPSFAERFIVWANDARNATNTLNAGVRQALLSGAAAVPFDPEIQILGGRVAVYPAGRNDDIGDVETLSGLVDFTRSVARALSK